MTAGLLLLAASGLARETAEAARAGGRTVVGCLDDDPGLLGREVGPGLPVLGDIDSAADHADVEFVLCAGRGSSRRVIESRLEALGVTRDRFATVSDPSVSVPASCRVGPGCILLAGTVLTADVTVGAHVVCMPHVVLTHDDVVGDFATLCAGVVLGGGVRIGEAAYLGMSCGVKERTAVGADAIVGMGAVVLDDVPPGACVVGVPAREMRRSPS